VPTGSLLNEDRDYSRVVRRVIQRSVVSPSIALPGEDAIMRKEGERLIIEPTPPKSLLALLAILAPLDEEFPPISDPHPEPVDL